MQLSQINVFWIIVTILFVLFLILLTFMALRGQYKYKFEERTVRANYLEEARAKLFNPRSTLIETDDPAIL